MSQRVAIIIGSSSDLGQMTQGLKTAQSNQANIEVEGVYVRSAHRHFFQLVILLFQLARDGVTVIITGAGMSNALTGMTETIVLRLFRTLAPVFNIFGLWNLSSDDLLEIRIVGVAFEGKTDEDTQAAILSTAKVPGSQVVCGDDAGPFVGQKGFARAILYVASCKLPKVLNAPAEKPIEDFTINEAIAEAMKKN